MSKKRVAMITSGGDASGINGVFHGLVALHDIEVFGFQGGYDGIVNNEPIALDENLTSSFILKAESILQTARSINPRTKEGRQLIVDRLKKYEIDSLVVCGGDGSGKAAYLLSEMGVDTLLIPMTIDNNIYGTEYTVGYYTALATIRTTIQNIHQTGHNMPGRIFMIETFGGDSGQLTLASTLFCGADLALIPERKLDIEKIVARIKEVLSKKNQCIILCCEANFLSKEYHLGDQGGSFELGKKITSLINKRVRHSILGYSQRAGDPSLEDIEKGLLMGFRAGEALISGETRKMVGIKNNNVVLVPLEEIANNKKGLNETNYTLAEKLNIIL